MLPWETLPWGYGREAWQGAHFEASLRKPADPGRGRQNPDRARTEPGRARTEPSRARTEHGRAAGAGLAMHHFDFEVGYGRGVGYEVAIPVFEGPFEVLLSLVQAKEIDIYDVPLAEVIDAFLVHVASLEAVDLDLMSEFLVIAAILVELKTRQMLPQPEPLEMDDDVAYLEQRDLLLQRLLECRTFARAGERLEAMIALAARSVPRLAGLEDSFIEIAPDLLSGVTPERLRKAFAKALQARPPSQAIDTSHVLVDRVTVAEAVMEVASVLPSLGRTTFRALTEGLVERIEVIVRFLALLELCKQGRVELDQGATFGDLVVCWTGGSVDTEVLLAEMEVSEARSGSVAQ